MTIIELEAHRHTITTPQGPVSCIDVGSGPVALFVHGLGTNALLWRHVIRAFADDRRCVAIDLPLHGRTPVAAGRRSCSPADRRQVHRAQPPPERLRVEGPVAGLLLEGIVLRLQADLRWLEACERKRAGRRSES